MIKFLSILIKNIVCCALVTLGIVIYFAIIPAVITAVYDVFFSGMSKETLDNLNEWYRLRHFALSSLCWYVFTGIFLVSFGRYKETKK